MHAVHTRYVHGARMQVRASCVEIYNESVIDLVKFSRQNRTCEHLPVKFDTSRASFFVQVFYTETHHTCARAHARTHTYNINLTLSKPSPCARAYTQYEPYPQ